MPVSKDSIYNGEPCEFCGAGAGESCKNPNGTEYKFTHRARLGPRKTIDNPEGVKR